MSKNNSASLLLPSTPPALCFNKEHFTKDDFDVDHFVVECRRHTSLDALRTDLHIYLKILQNAMIELINKDYADFLNLSTNLVGMDRSINHLIQPLNLIKKDISEVKGTAGERLRCIEEKLQLKGALERKKESLKEMALLLNTLNQSLHLQTLINSQEGLVRCQTIERLSGHLSNMQVLLEGNKHTKLACQIFPRLEAMQAEVRAVMQEDIRRSFNKETELPVLLRSYATMGMMSEAEDIFREHVVKEFMMEAIGEDVLRQRGLEGMYEGVLQFIPLHCGLIKRLTAGCDDWLGGYDMLVNGVWPEVVRCIDLNTPSIFAPGNPDVFQERYKTSMRFVSRFEKSLTSVASVKRLRGHPSYASFKARWALSIYFQIRFQEIAGRLETSLLTPFQLNNLTREEGEVVGKNEVTWEVKPSTQAIDMRRFKLQCSVTLCQCLSACWSEAVFLHSLLHRFWKLSLQLVSRYTTWLQHLSVQVSEQSSPPATSSSPPDHVHTYLHVLCDVSILSSTLEAIFESEVCPLMLARKDVDLKLIKEAWKEAQAGLQRHTPSLMHAISAHLSTSCLAHLKAVNNIPRLYKRTNREAPTTSSPYVESITLPLSTFAREHRASLPPSDLACILSSVVCTVSEQYQSLIVEVLTSLRRMEESLKRLKAARQTTGLASAGSSSGQGDDDKIKKQLCLDVGHFVQQVSALALKEQPEMHSALQKLQQAVESSTS